MRRLIAVLILSACLTASSRAIADEPELEKIWKFQGKQGVIEIRLTRFINSDGAKPTSLEIGSSNGGPSSVVEEAAFLAKVLDEMPSAGVSPQSLVWISFRLLEPEAVGRVAIYAASSKRWRRALKTKSVASVYPLVTRFLNESGAYQEWDMVFRNHDLGLKVAGVEKVIMEPFSRSGATCPEATDCSHLLVPSDALVQMNVVPAK
jgi:hypothetical protein